MIDLDRQVFVAFDTETTGLSPHNANVIEIAGVRFLASGHEISRFTTLANPGVAIDKGTTKIHGIDDAMVAPAPNPVQACKQFVQWIGRDDILIAYNAPFDVGFISSELTRGRVIAPANRVIDFLKCARSLELPVENFKLRTLVEYFELTNHDFHRAMGDAVHLKELFVLFLEQCPEDMRERLLEEANVPTHSEMTGAGRVHLPSRFAQLPEAVERGTVLEIAYQDDDPDARRSGGVRRILPVNLCELNAHDYLIAQCMSDGRVRHFRLDRLISVHEARDRRPFRTASY